MEENPRDRIGSGNFRALSKAPAADDAGFLIMANRTSKLQACLSLEVEH